VTANLVATLVVDDIDAGERSGLVAKCALANEGDEAIVVNRAPMSSPSLALEIVDEHGQLVHQPPPPVPPTDIPLASLAPGERISVEYRGFVPAWVPPGRYRVRFRYVPGSGGRWHEGDQSSDWVDFETF
jgi:hypothetical protein